MTIHHGPIVCRSGDYDVIECETCGFKHVDPLPTEAELDHIYQNEYYTTTIPDYVPSPTPRRPTGSNTLRSFLG